jgi:hypothetical protein
MSDSDAEFDEFVERMDEIERERELGSDGCPRDTCATWMTL